MVNEIIKIINLSKKYKLKGKVKEIIALNNVSISIKEGEIFGLLGPNGAGKTTLIQILTTLLQPNSGKVIIDGHNVLKKPNLAKNKVALMLESDMIYIRISGYYNLKFFCKLYQVTNYKEKIQKIVKEFGLEKIIHQLVETYSSGMKMKLALCRTLLLERKILFLDEPTLGLDVKSIRFIIEKLKNLKKTIFLTSYDMNVVERLCDRIAFINKGTILKIGTKEDIKKFEESERRFEIKVIENKNKLKIDLEKLEFISNIIETDEGLNFDLKNREKLNQIFQILGNYNVYYFKEQEQSLEDLFLKNYEK